MGEEHFATVINPRALVNIGIGASASPPPARELKEVLVEVGLALNLVA